ncbi:cation channel sperm-associated targeting subunit tau isoform X4 [Oryctolagus cuniculus]|uniref:cation channel sperm-associated targeting subunit tau isoform X4 n=1 Tax=Oryctolagus cuniculus TaxID=9986 RepID=UPI003879FEEC
MEPPKEAPRLSNAFENRDGRLHPPFAAQFLQKSAPGHPDAMHVRGSEYPSVRHGQDHGRTALPKDKNKEGTGYRLLNMLRKTLKGSESEELEVTPEIPTLVPFGDVVGCLAIHIKNCRHFMSKISSQHYTNLFIRISINNVVKSTKLCSLLSRNNEKVNVIEFDEVKYFSVKVPRRQDDERNNIYLELMQHDSKEKYPLFLGSSELHLYEVIQKGCFTEELQMMNKNTFICRVEVEFMFSYGNFGYGFSHQLKPLQKIIEPSMFMKVAPPPERTDPVTNVILPQPVEYPAFLSPDLNVTVGNPNTMPQLNQPSMVRLEKLQQQPRERLEQMKTEYRNLRTWMEKVGYLDKIINPKLEDKDSKEIMNEALESQHSDLSDEMPEDTLALDVIPEDKEDTPTELPDSDEKEDFTIPSLKQLYHDNAIAGTTKSDGSTTLSTDTALPSVPSLEITEGKKIQPLPEHLAEDVPGGKMKNLLFPLDVKSCGSNPRILKADSSLAEMRQVKHQRIPGGQREITAFSKDLKDGIPQQDWGGAVSQRKKSPSRIMQDSSQFSPVKEYVSLPYFPDVLSRTPQGHKNSNKKGKSVAFSPEENNSPFLKPLYREFTPDYQKFHLGSFDPFLRNINNKMSDRIKKDKYICKSRSYLYTEEIELEDQDPPFPTCSQFAEPTVTPWAHDPSVTMKTLNPKEDGPGKSPAVAESVSKKYLEADEKDFPMKKKSSFKKKHLISEVSSCKSSFHGSVPDCVIKQIFTAPMSRLEMGVTESSETDMNLQDQLPTRWGRSLSSHVLVHYGEENDEIELPQSKSVVSQIIQAFPIGTLLESGLIKVIELDKEYQRSSLLDTAAASREGPGYSTGGFTEIKRTAEPLSRRNTPTIPNETAFASRVGLIEEDPKMPPQHSAYHLRPDKKPVLPSNGHRLDREENDLSSILENFSNSITSKLDDSDAVMLKSFLRSILKAFFTHNQSEMRRQPEKELERLIKNDFPSFTEHLEETPGNLNKADMLHRKPILNARLRVFLEELSELEVKNLKSELSKQIQHYLVERLSEAGHIAKEDLPKIYQNLYLMNEKAGLKAQNVFQEKYSETVRQIMSFVNNFNHHFIDKHLEIKLRSFLNEILQNYFLKNLSESSLFNETASEAIHNNIASLRTKSAPLSYPELGQEIASGSFGRRLEINMKYPLNKSLQNYLLALSENELLSLKADLSKHFQSLFIEKLSKAGLVTERQLEGINHHLRLLNSSSTPLKCIKSALPVRDDNHSMAEHAEKENKYSKTVPKNTLQKTPKDQCVETELIRREDNDYFFLHNLKENPATIKEDKSYYPREEAATLSLVKIQPSSNKNIQAIALNKSPERLTDMLLKKPRKEHGSVQFPPAENSLCTTEHQDPYGWGGKSKVTQSKACFDMTLKMKPLGKKEHINIYKLTVQERPKAVLSPYPRIPNSKIPREDEKHLDRLPFPSWQTNTLGYFNSETGGKPKQEEQYCQRLKGNNNNNKRHVVTFAQYSQEIQSLFLNPNEICEEKYARIPESQSFKIIEDRKDSRSSFFPEVLKRENLKLKVRKERDYAAKPKKSFNKIVRMLPSALPATRSHLRKSVPRTLLHWTARRTIHDCSDKFEDLPVTSLKHLTKTKSRARLLGKSPDDSHNQAKHSARPYTAPEHYKRRENHTARFGGPRMVSAGLVHINDTTIDYEIRKMHPPKKLKEDIEKCSLICDIIQMLNSSK